MDIGADRVRLRPIVDEPVTQQPDGALRLGGGSRGPGIVVAIVAIS